MHWVKFVGGGVGHNDDAAFTHEWFIAIQIEVITKTSTHDQDGVHDGVDVVRANERDSHCENVGLTLHLYKLLAVHIGRSHFVNCLYFASLNTCHLVWCFNGLEYVSAHASRGATERC